MSIKAIAMTEPGHLEPREFPEPKLEDGMVLVRMLMAGICGTDRHVLEGYMPLDFPVIPGHENLGVIGRIAGEVKDVYGRPLAAGDRIVWDAAYWTCGECYYCNLKMRRWP